MTVFKLCKLRKGGAYQVVMLPAQYAERNCLVKLRYLNGAWRNEEWEPWDQGWRVDFVYDQTAHTEEYAHQMSIPQFSSKKKSRRFYLPEVELSDPPKTEQNE